MTRIDDVSKITASLTWRLITSLTTELLDNLTLTAVIDKDDEIYKGGGSRIIRNLF